jgi:hypothetical protein
MSETNDKSRTPGPRDRLDSIGQALDRAFREEAGDIPAPIVRLMLELSQEHPIGSAEDAAPRVHVSGSRHPTSMIAAVRALASRFRG